MKKHIAAISAILLIPVILAGCMLRTPGKDNGTPPASPPSRGVVENNVYTNDYADVTFTAPEDWDYTSDEDMAALFGADTKAMGKPGGEFTEEMMNAEAVYDMFVINNTTLSSVAVLFQNMKDLNYDESQYLSLLKITLKSNPDTVIHDIADYQLGSQSYKVMQCDGADSTQYYYVRRIGDIMLCMILTTFKGEDISTITDCFS